MLHSDSLISHTIFILFVPGNDQEHIEAEEVFHDDGMLRSFLSKLSRQRDQYCELRLACKSTELQKRTESTSEALLGRESSKQACHLASRSFKRSAGSWRESHQQALLKAQTGKTIPLF